jgi:hypothetical protein
VPPPLYSVAGVSPVVTTILAGGNFGYLKVTIDAKLRSLTCEFMGVKDGKAVSLNSHTISI